MSHSYVIELIVSQNSNFAKLFCVFFIIFSFSLSFSYKKCTFTRFLIHFALLFLSYFHNFYVLFLYTLHNIIIPIAYFRLLVDHYAISITTKKNIPQNISFMKCSFLFFILIRNLINRICHSIYVFVTI